MDGNTRLCTATSAAALKASFGADGQPGSYADVDRCDAQGCEAETAAQLRWLRTRMKQAAPQALVVAR